MAWMVFSPAEYTKGDGRFVAEEEIGGRLDGVDGGELCPAELRAIS